MAAKNKPIAEKPASPSKIRVETLAMRKPPPKNPGRILGTDQPPCPSLCASARRSKGHLRSPFEEKSVMKVLAFAEERGGKFKKSSLETTQAARAVADALHAEFCGLVVGTGVRNLAPGLGAYGADRVIAVDNPVLAEHSNTACAKAIAEVASKEHADLIFLPASQMGKDLAPRVAVRLGAGLASDCVAVKAEGGDVLATRRFSPGRRCWTFGATPVKVFSPASECLHCNTASRHCFGRAGRGCV